MVRRNLLWPEPHPQPVCAWGPACRLDTLAIEHQKVLLPRGHAEGPLCEVGGGRGDMRRLLAVSAPGSRHHI